MALEARRLSRASSSGARNRASAASCAASASPTPSSGRRRPASKAPKSASTASARVHAVLRQRSPRARATRPSSSRSCATGSASIPTTSSTSRATPTRSFFGEGTGGSRSATHRRARRSYMAAREDHRPRPRQIAAHLLEGRCRRHQVRRRHLLQRQDQPHADHQGGGEGRRSNPAKLPKDMEAGLYRDRDLHAPTCENFPNGVPRLRGRDRSRDRRRSRSCATTWSTTSAP